jgi:hypothetical protein
VSKNLTSEGREMVDGLASMLKKEKNCVDIRTRRGVQSIAIDELFTGTITITFNLGGYAGAEKHEKIK